MFYVSRNRNRARSQAKCLCMAAVLCVGAWAMHQARAGEDSLREAIEALLSGDGIADGRLDPELIAILSQAEYTVQDIDPNAEGWLGVIGFGPTQARVTQVRPWPMTGAGVAVIRTDVLQSEGLPGPDGFRDAAISDTSLPDFCGQDDGEQLCDWNALGGGYGEGFNVDFSVLRSCYNVGQLVAIYLPDSDGLLPDPDNPIAGIVDDSILYVGLDIANGESRTVQGPGTPSRNVDVRLMPDIDSNPGTWQNNGLPVLYSFDPPVFPTIVPYDTDGDGHPNTLTRFLNLPGIGNYDVKWFDTPNPQEVYGVRILLCQEDQISPVPDTGFQEVYLNATGPDTLDLFWQVFDGGPPLDDSLVETAPPFGVTSWPDNPAATIFESIAARGEDGEFNDDVEFLFKEVDSWVWQYYHDLNGEPYEVSRLRLATGGIFTTSDSTPEGSAEDFASVQWFLPIPDIEVKKRIRCQDEVSSTAWREPSDTTPIPVLDAVGGAVVDFELTVSNHGNVPLDVSVLDEVASLCGDATITPITAAITDGGNGIVNTEATGDDIQVFPLGATLPAPDPDTPFPLVIILPGENGAIDTTPAGDDKQLTSLINPALRVTLARAGDYVIDGGNNIATSQIDPTDPDGDDVQVVPFGTPVPPGAIIIGPGPNGVIDASTTVGGDDVVSSGMGQIPPQNADALGFASDFFVDFLPSIDTDNDPNDAVLLGPLNPIDVCNDIDGDQVRIFFRAVVTVDEQFCNECEGGLVDIENHVTVFGEYTEPTPTITVFDTDNVVPDTIREVAQDFDDNVVAINVLCRNVDFEKTVALCDDCGDPEGCNEFVDNLTIPAGAFGEPEEPICIRYRYQVFNYGEVDEEVLITDEDLCEDVNNTTGVSFVPGECEVCPSGVTITVPKAVGGTPGEASVYCMIEIETSDDLAAFLAVDDNAPAQCPDDPPGESNPYCYTNCGLMSATATNLGDICIPETLGSIDLDDDATVCTVECELTVTKQVVCLTECGPNGELIGDYEGTIEVIPGSCVRFKIEIENTSDPQFSDSCGACELTLADEMATQPGQITFQDNVVFTLYRNGNPITCSTPAGFNVNGTPFDWDPGACGGTEYFEIGDVLEITFDARIPDTADPALDASNAVTQLNGTTPCEPPPNCCGPAFTVVGLPEAIVTLDILPFDIECTKEWSVLWDADADCEPGPDPEGYIDYSNNIDLGTADGGEAIVFPAILCQRVTVDNVGDVDANVTLTEQDLINAVNTTPGVSFVDEDACEIGDTKLVTAGDSETWDCCIRVETAAAMRDLATNDGGTNSGIFETKAEVSGEPTGVCPGNGDEAECEAEITPPPECSLNVTKEVFCIECPNGNIIDPPPGGDTMEAAPNACVRFVVTVQNTSGTVKIPRIKVDDLMTPNLGFTACSALLGATDATTCICDQGFNTNGVQREFTFGACRPFPGNPWISPGEALTISFDLTLGEVDILNEVTVEAYAEACAPPPPLEDESCAEADAEAEVEVLLPEIDCDKTISVDNNDDGSIEYGPSSSILLDDTTVSFPMRLIYTYTVYNTGDVPLTNVVLCDDTLVNQALMAGATVGPCDLCTGACDGTNDTCLTLPDIPLSGSETATCEILIPDEAALIAFVGGEGETYENIAVVTADGDYTGTEVCDSGPGPDPLETECDARITYNPEGCPSTKAKFWIWNENEVLFSGTERCVIAWDERYLSQWTIGAIPGAPDPPNNFLNTWLQTNLGHARLDGMESTLCPDSVDMPILAVLSQVIEFGGEPPQYAYSGANVQGAGQEAGQLTMLDLEDPMPANLDDGEQAGEPLGGDDRELPVSGGNAELPSLPDPPPAPDRVDATTKGSLLVFPKIELKWDAQGNLIQDTFITLNNDFTSGVQIKLFFVAHPLDPEVDCQFWVDNDIMLTENEPTYWSVRTGLPKGVSPFTVISDAMHPDPDPRNPGGLRMHGWVVAWAVDGNFQEIRWNHLYGGATIVRYDHGDAWEYSAAAFRGLIGDETGDLLLEPYGQLDLDGDEYDWMPSMLMFDFYAPDAVLISKDGRQIRVLDSDLAIWLGINNLTD